MAAMILIWMHNPVLFRSVGQSQFNPSTSLEGKGGEIREEKPRRFGRAKSFFSRKYHVLRSKKRSLTAKIKPFEQLSSEQPFLYQNIYSFSQICPVLNASKEQPSILCSLRFLIMNVLVYLAYTSGDVFVYYETRMI